MKSQMGQKTAIRVDEDCILSLSGTQDDRESRESRLEATQGSPFVLNDGTMMEATAQQTKASDHSSCWGYLQRGATRINLTIREARDGRVNAHVLGRNNDCDIIIADRKVSGKHCIIYCVYESIMARMRVFVEDTR